MADKFTQEEIDIILLLLANHWHYFVGAAFAFGSFMVVSLACFFHIKDKIKEVSNELSSIPILSTAITSLKEELHFVQNDLSSIKTKTDFIGESVKILVERGIPQNIHIQNDSEIDFGKKKNRLARQTK